MTEQCAEKLAVDIVIATDEEAERAAVEALEAGANISPIEVGEGATPGYSFKEVGCRACGACLRLTYTERGGISGISTITDGPCISPV
jgi:hypothetical protein